jgi:hypothetical protein
LVPLQRPVHRCKERSPFSDSDFGSPTPPPTPPIRISKPFHAAVGEVLSFDFEEYGTNNVTGLTTNNVDCGACEMVIVALPLSPPPGPAKNGTILGTLFFSYNVTHSTDYVLIFDTRSYSPCSGSSNCFVKLSGTVIANIPVGPSPYSSAPAALAILGATAIVPPVFWALQKRRRQGDDAFTQKISLL